MDSPKADIYPRHWGHGDEPYITGLSGGLAATRRGSATGRGRPFARAHRAEPALFAALLDRPTYAVRDDFPVNDVARARVPTGLFLGDAIPEAAAGIGDPSLPKLENALRLADVAERTLRLEKRALAADVAACV